MANSTTSKISCPQFGCAYSPQLMIHGAHNSCCDSVRPAIHDSLSSHSVCPCQLDRVLQQRVSSMPVNLLPRPPFSEAGFTIGPAAEFSAFYSPLARSCDLKEVSQAWRDSWYLAQAAAARHPLELHGFDPHTHGTCPRLGDRFSPIDLAAAGARRKNATRETTSTLKAWLYEHRKNPYPTKGEKIMLAIITKMTLTQVSTWFANARRRLKKENKMTWSPRNRCGDKKDDNEDAGSDSDGEHSSEEDKLGDDNDEDRTSLKEVEDKEERKENIQLNEDTPEPPKNQNCDNDGSVVKPKNQMIKFPALRPVQTGTIVPSNVEDSPVKSLRRWVDGCFHNTTVNSVNLRSVAGETPPSTPPQRTSTETTVITSVCSSTLTPSLVNTEKKERESPSRSSSSNEEMAEQTKEDTIQAFRPIETRGTETTNYREFDAALALTTLSAR